jgi:DNA-directed RNA polymerase subunit RPC12/RpoP
MENFFEQFQGADIERFIDCLKAIRLAGLRTDKYTQAGVNQSSGNVWVWDEDWAGCVYCSIGFDVSWSYTCNECGEEFDFDSYAEMEAFAEDNAEDCTMCRTEEVTA